MKEKVEQGDRSRDADALRAAFPREGCAVCAVILEHMQMVMDSWQYEDFTDVEHRHEVIRTRGFCPLHTWQLAQLHTSFQLAVIYREVLADVIDALERDRQSASGRPGATHSFLERLRGHSQSAGQDYALPLFEQCYFCQARANIEQRLIDTFVGLLHSQEDRALMSQSTGLCLLHFTQARSHTEARDPQALHHLLDCQSTCMRRVLDEVEELVRKHDYRYKDEPRGDEMTSWRRAAELCAGQPGVR
jgi:hypothetical protein